MKSDKLLKQLINNGWYEIRQKGSHKILTKEGRENKIVIPYHRGKEVPTGTCHRSLLIFYKQINKSRNRA